MNLPEIFFRPPAPRKFLPELPSLRTIPTTWLITLALLAAAGVWAIMLLWYFFAPIMAVGSLLFALMIALLRWM